VEGNTDTTAHRQTAAIVRITWFVTFVVPLVLAALLLGMKSAQAAPPVPGFTPLAFEEEFEGEEESEGEFELEACEIAEEEFEEGELGEAAVEVACDEAEDEGGKKAAAPSAFAPEECLLRSAHAQAVASPKHESLKLIVGYTTYEPVAATVEIGKGSARIGSVHRHLGRSGVLRIVKSLERDKAPSQIVVRIVISDAPRYCGKFQTQKIPVSGVGGDRAPRHKRHRAGHQP
jgi:hypothetical protein